MVSNGLRGPIESIIDKTRNYIVNYKQDQDRISKKGCETMDCSELVCRYAAKIEWSRSPKWWGTKDLIKCATNHPEWLIKRKDNIPKRGDIFLWNGHTGIVIEYDKNNDIVTTIESISSTTKGEKPIDYENYPNTRLKGVVKMKFYRTDKHLIGHGIPCYFYSFAVHYSKQDKK